MSAPLQAALVCLTLVAFAANSLLNRAALAGGGIDPASFAVIRVAAGAATLLVLAALQGSLRRPGLRDLGAAVGLALYMLGFSFAYLELDAGFGALLLFGGVQVAMFAGALALGEAMPARRWIGALIAFGGLVVLLRPGAVPEGAMLSGALMVLAALGWSVFSLIGRRSAAPLADTALAFALCLPVVAVPVLTGLGPAAGAEIAGKGIVLAVISGAVTSGCGYALWYRILPLLGASRAAVAQLSVPVIAVLGGVLLLGEAVRPSMIVAGALVAAGVSISLRGGPQRRIGSSGS